MKYLIFVFVSILATLSSVVGKAKLAFVFELNRHGAKVASKESMPHLFTVGKG